MWDIRWHPRLDQDLKRLDKPIRRKLRDEIFPHVMKNPHKGKRKSGDLIGVWAWEATSSAGEPRILYEIIPQDQVVLVIGIGTHEGFYPRMKRRLRGRKSR